ncbi:hypothetical protein PVAP13_2KG378205 [Panicum virgatum]|uniref:Uncharacterized protein n=1 Tax=Panicum virgatum TaxID=38727 RepID=A0A8T0WC67_PANVG|nr:hypothetical protein PVAP13_2KG378205 [Panicum virgatum]
MCLPRHPSACACRCLAAAACACRHLATAASSPALQLAHGAPRRVSRGYARPAELRGGRAGEGQARRPPSPSPAPPPSRAPAVALGSPSSSVRGHGAATLPCSLGGERGRRSTARAAGRASSAPPWPAGGRAPRRASSPASFKSAAESAAGPPSPRRSSASHARREAREGRSPAEATPGRGAAPPGPAGSREERPRRSARARAELLPREPSSSSRRSAARRDGNSPAPAARPHPAAPPPRARGGKQGRGAHRQKRNRGGAPRRAPDPARCASVASGRASSPGSFESAASLLPGKLQIGGGIGGGPALAPPLLRLARKEGSKGGALAGGGEAGEGRRAAWPCREQGGAPASLRPHATLRPRACGHGREGGRGELGHGAGVRA